MKRFIGVLLIACMFAIGAAGVALADGAPAKPDHEDPFLQICELAGAEVVKWLEEKYPVLQPNEQELLAFKDALCKLIISAGEREPYKSCTSRCKSECSGADQARCFATCPTGCHPACCGCKSESSECYHGCVDCGGGTGQPCAPGEQPAPTIKPKAKK